MGISILLPGMISGCKYFITAIFTVISLSVLGQANFLLDQSGISKVDLEVEVSTPEHLKLYLKSAEREVAGRWEVRKHYITFLPFLPLDFASDYEVTYLGERIAAFRTPDNVSNPPRLLSIHPTPDSLPENLLKMQLVFDREMQSGKSSEFVMIREQGQNGFLENVFLDLSPELWNPGGDTLTLWLNPGRIKRDLIPNREEGNPLRQGTSYELLILNGWMSAQGQPLPEAVSKKFYVTRADRSRIDPSRWKMKFPELNTKQSLIIMSNEPLDLLSAPAAIQIMKADGEKVQGVVSISTEQSRIVFTPISNWITGRYIVEIKNTIEDLSGNRIDRLFDEDLTDSSAPSGLINQLEFTIK
ncbi:Ig-like domain-containing protein [Fulvivirga sedimenti]|uniref:Ig-like domain-containing protein n=1 Tax=Fulvivirga sedimenti TaxID=2879465 RepID=A0A9X1HT87_9BACT|nr:Ig-like domain-containing protein [Fulvivirga sedimenti]MCA6074565.1 Ig-like domain-containing protein [Fulvivirga sedimenti]MCA6075742.1 Ig-like domain-containing protein [Fulvivirga sedimenti]MCA6076870.1 Ig-like domain-containing protein [Fulvivirga sedimenti]